MKQKKKSDVAVLLGYAGSHKGLTFLGLALSAVSMLLSMAPYICIWLAARDLIAVAPDWTEAQSVAQYGWLAFAFAVAGIILYCGMFNGIFEIVVHDMPRDQAMRDVDQLRAFYTAGWSKLMGV